MRATCCCRSRRLRVHGPERLVHQEHGRVGGQRAGDPDALAFTARELVRVAVPVRPERQAHEV
jgi:hypothetical protein